MEFWWNSVKYSILLRSLIRGVRQSNFSQISKPFIWHRELISWASFQCTYASSVHSFISKNTYGFRAKRFEENTAWNITGLTFLPDRKNRFAFYRPCVIGFILFFFFILRSLSSFFAKTFSALRAVAVFLFSDDRELRADNRQMVAARWTRSREVARSFWLYGKRRWDKLLRDQGIRTISGTVSRNGSDAERRLDLYSLPTRPPDDHLTFTPSSSCSTSLPPPPPSPLPPVLDM